MSEIPTPAERRLIASGLYLRDRLCAQQLDADLEWLVPVGTFVGYLTAYGIPVRRVAGLAEGYLAHRLIYPLPRK